MKSEKFWGNLKLGYDNNNSNITPLFPNQVTVNTLVITSLMIVRGLTIIGKVIDNLVVI
jgi:hypothetical protein